MRRFARAFLTTSVILVLLVNLIAILLYGRQFYACVTEAPRSEFDLSFAPTASAGCGQNGLVENGWAFGAVNGFLLFALVLIWFAVRYVYLHFQATDKY